MFEMTDFDGIPGNMYEAWLHGVHDSFSLLFTFNTFMEPAHPNFDIEALNWVSNDKNTGKP